MPKDEIASKNRLYSQVLAQSIFNLKEFLNSSFKSIPPTFRCLRFYDIASQWNSFYSYRFA